jgi:hypothetical protein
MAQRLKNTDKKNMNKGAKRNMVDKLVKEQALGVEAELRCFRHPLAGFGALIG